MRFDRLLLASAACALVAGAATAQTTTSTSTTRTATGSAMGQPTTGAATSNTTGMTSDAQPAAGAMSNSTAMSSGAQPATSGANTTGMSSGTAGAMGAPASASAPFRQIAPAAGASLVDVLKASGQFTTLLKAVTATNLTAVLQRPGSLTVFAPTDAAFAALPPGQLATLMQPANATQLQQLVLLHVVNTPIRSADVLNHTAINVATVATGKSVHIDGSSGAMMVDGDAVLQPDVKASNGTIFVIGNVLSPTYVPPAAPSAASLAASSSAQSATTTGETTSTTTTSTPKKPRR